MALIYDHFTPMVVMQLEEYGYVIGATHIMEGVEQSAAPPSTRSKAPSLRSSPAARPRCRPAV